MEQKQRVKGRHIHVGRQVNDFAPLTLCWFDPLIALLRRVSISDVIVV